MALLTNITETAKLVNTAALQKVQSRAILLDPGVVISLPPINVSPKVIAQTPAQGSFVPRGTKVNLTLGNGRTLPANIVQGGLTSWAELNLGTLYDQNIKNDPLVDGLVAKFDQNGTLSTSEQTLLQTTLAGKGVQFGTGAGTDINAALQTLAAARTFNINGL
jgi:hypothetical protein